MIHAAYQIVLCVVLKAEREEAELQTFKCAVQQEKILVYIVKPEVGKVTNWERRGSKSRNLQPLLEETMTIKVLRVFMPLGQSGLVMNYCVKSDRFRK